VTKGRLTNTAAFNTKTMQLAGTESRRVRSSFPSILLLN